MESKISIGCNWLATGLLILVVAWAMWLVFHKEQPPFWLGGCQDYVPVKASLVAHAGGGLPEQTYANNRKAIDLAVKHGFRLIELDFMMKFGRLTIGHDGVPESDMTPEALMEWLDLHPDATIVTDFKTDNIAGLTSLAKIAGPRLNRFVPQIYSPEQFSSVVALGFPPPILTIYNLPDTGWHDAANALPLRAVTIPYERRHLSRGIRHPIFLHTVNRPMEGFGLYTDCLVPDRGTEGRALGSAAGNSPLGS